MTSPFLISFLHRSGVFVLFMFLMLLSACQTISEDAGLGNWADVTLRVTGVGAIEKDWSIAERIQAIQRAKVDAYAQLESQIMALETTSGDKMTDLVTQDEGMQKKIAAFVRGAKIIRTVNDETGVKIVIQLFLGDPFKATIGLAKRKQQELSNPNTGGNSSSQGRSR